MGQSNPQLSDALKRLSAAKYGKPRAVVEKEIFDRLGAAEAEKKAKAEQAKKTQEERMTGMSSGGAGSSFLDEWLAKRKQISSSPAPSGPLPPQMPTVAPIALATPLPPLGGPSQPTSFAPMNPPISSGSEGVSVPPSAATAPQAPSAKGDDDQHLHLRGDRKNPDSEVSVKLR